jgi:hypothetical protein
MLFEERLGGEERRLMHLSQHHYIIHVTEAFSSLPTARPADPKK